MAYSFREVRITSCQLEQELLQERLLELLRQLLELQERLLELLVPQLQELQEQEEHLFCHKQLKR